jgi:GxxExxY protein
MNEEKTGLKHENLTHEIIGCAMEVLNGVGHGLHEKPYENAMAVEFRLRNLAFSQQSRYDVIYKDVKIAEYIPDLIVEDTVIVDAKVIEGITKHEVGQMINYLKITGLPVGLIINFKHTQLEWRRLVL